MRKISDSTNTANAAGEFTEGSAAGGIPATLLRADWLNTVQRELVGLVEGAGLPLAANDDSQVLKAIVGLIAAAVSGKANTESAELTGSPTAPTQAVGNNSTRLANTAFVQAAVAALVNSSPAALDTLKELAAALGNDPDFATTMTNAMAGKQPLDGTLTALAGIATAADRLIYSTGVDQFATTPLSAFIRTLLDDANADTALLTLGAAPLASPELTGNPTAPTQPVGNNSTRLANTAFVQAAVAALVNSSPAALDTLKELAAALGNDPNFAATMTNALAGKADKATTLAGYGITDATSLVRSVLAQFGIGVSYVGEIISGALADARETGFYHCSGNVPDSPADVDGFVIEGKGSGQRRVQVYITLSSGAIFFRTQPNSAFGDFNAWRQVWDSVSLPIVSLNAASATKLANARTLLTNLGSASAAAFDGTANAIPGVTGVLGIANGGTGGATAAAARAGIGAGVPATASFGIPGWWKDNDTGLIVQWGIATITTTNVGGVATISLPISYPNNHFGAIGNYRKASLISDSFPVSTYPASRSTLTLVLDAATGGSTPTGAQEAFYISIGH
ncbi:pyocin knob domain-containing protein [Stutzerimonas kirkiae]|uniref:pyocin knob domain-containing protein n=1 Tax=Stutzerimonas kirkiae TaxID=2211392 RepID=UPI0010385D68|nr:pyocin knob domain-containing protein [Stutzerimonas kirkiae]TBV12745.1 hypothetical protein DNK01_13750 [Stutzerimonas kirkiae]